LKIAPAEGWANKQRTARYERLKRHDSAGSLCSGLYHMMQVFMVKSICESAVFPTMPGGHGMIEMRFEVKPAF